MRFLEPGKHTEVVVSPDTELSPIRLSQLDPQLWLKKGYEPQDTSFYLGVMSNLLEAKNIQLELRVPGGFTIV
jgi:hypothetical protein